MASTNDITGDAIASKANSDAYRNNYDRIFGKSKAAPAVAVGAFRASRAEGQADAPEQAPSQEPAASPARKLGR